jgi:hypothetical protein
VWQSCKQGACERCQCMGLLFITSAQQKVLLAFIEITGLARLSVSDKGKVVPDKTCACVLF